MPDLDMAHVQHGRVNALLDRLAGSLGCSTEAFSDQGRHELNQTLELLNLWFALDEPQDPAKTLSFMRDASAKARAPDEVGAPSPGEPVAFPHAMQKPNRAP